MDAPTEIQLPIGAADVARIVAIADPILRNLWITQTYADFSSRLRTMVAATDETWCGFAVWASATAGQSIRREEVPAIIARLLGADHHQACLDEVNERYRHLRRVRIVPEVAEHHVVAAFAGPIDAVADHIAHGNTLVYAELAPLFVSFLELLEAGQPAEVTPDAVDAALDQLATSPIDADVRSAFHRYFVAVTDADPARRAWSILAGNVLAVAHEQHRLQADIGAAVDAGFVSAEDVVGRLVPRWVPDLIVKLLTKPVRRPIEILVRRLWEEAATELLMTLRVPGAALRLSRTLPPLPDGQMFPGDLAELGDGDDAAPYREWDRTSGTGHHDEAHDWVALRQRMSYIVNLFRSRQQDSTLAAAPFAAAQVEAMRRGTVPPPPLLPARHAPAGDDAAAPS
jgi:hypothetical protein